MHFFLWYAGVTYLYYFQHANNVVNPEGRTSTSSVVAVPQSSSDTGKYLHWSTMSSCLLILLSLKKDVRGALFDCLLGYISAMMLLNFSQITLLLLAWYDVLTYFVFVSGYKSIYGRRREDP
jgi:hypothetical protein